MAFSKQKRYFKARNGKYWLDSGLHFSRGITIFWRYEINENIALYSNGCVYTHYVKYTCKFTKNLLGSVNRERRVNTISSFYTETFLARQKGTQAKDYFMNRVANEI